MVTATPVEIGTLLYVKPSLAGGRLCVSGTGISVRTIAGLYNGGLSPEEIVAEYDRPDLSLAAVHAAIAHYLANQELMDAQTQESIDFAAAVSRLFPNGWRGEPLPPELQAYLETQSVR